jgi:DNA-binding phage protein
MLDKKVDGGNIDTMKDIRQSIKEIVKKRGSLRKVAEEVCIDHANLIRLMREGSDPRLKTIERIVDRLGYCLTLKKKEVKADKERPSKSKR